MTVIGKDCSLYFDDPANWAAPTPTLIADAVDVGQPGIVKNMVDLNSRGSGGWMMKGSGLKGMDVSFGYLYNAGEDPIFDALRAAFLLDTKIAFYVLDGPVDGIEGRKVQGFRFVAEVSEFPLNQELEDGERVEIKGELTRFKNTAGELVLPDWYEIAAL